MLEVALKVLNKIEENGYEAYIVGGFVRDYILNIKSNDIDICTNAKPKELLNIFEGALLPKEDYGSVTVFVKNIRFEITTYRKELSYKDFRRPDKIEYINDLVEDLTRRDFTINTICMDKNGNVIDKLNAKKDIDKRTIKTVGDANIRLKEDALRILRAIRFSVKLDFTLDKELIEGINRNKSNLRKISYERKKEELDKIFASPNAKMGIDLLVKLGIDKELELDNLSEVVNTESLIGIWSVLDIKENTYTFSNNEKSLIKDIKKALTLNNKDPYNLYKYGLYVNSIAASIKNIPKKDIASSYDNITIHSRTDLKITTEDMIKDLNIEKGPIIKEIYETLEKEVLYKRIKNDKASLIRYCKENFVSEGV